MGIRVILNDSHKEKKQQQRGHSLKATSNGINISDLGKCDGVEPGFIFAQKKFSND